MVENAQRQPYSTSEQQFTGNGADRAYLPGVWAGVGVAHSGDFILLGAHNLSARLYSLGDNGANVQYASININGSKFGLGLGGSVGAAFVLAHGYEDPQEMMGLSGRRDFDLAVGAKLGDFLKGARALRRVIETMEEYKKLTYVAENAIKNLGVNIREPGLITLPIPLAGIGLHGWVGYRFGDTIVTRLGYVEL